MARTKRASTRRTGSRKASTRRASTRRKSTSRTSARRTSARRPSTSRRTRSTRSKQPQGLRLTRKKQKQILTVVAVVVGLLILIFLLQNYRSVSGKKSAGGEIGRNVVYGKVVSVNVGPVRKEIRVKSLNTGKVYTFYVGWRTKFYPDRWPSPGERVKIYYLYDRGYLKATRVYLR